MSEYLQENRRAVIMLVVAVAVALLGGLYLLLSGGSESTILAPFHRANETLRRRRSRPRNRWIPLWQQ